MTRIGITGATGFVGTNLIEYLGDLDLSCIIERLDRQFLNTIPVRSIENLDVVIHCAGKAHDIKNTVDEQEYMYVNFELTKKVFDAFLASGACKFIFLSSVKAVADSVDNILYEDERPAPQTPYGKSKLKAEQYILSKTVPSGKQVYIFRPCMIHGPGNKGNLNLLFTFVKKGFPYPLAAFDNLRSFLSIENLCFVIAEIIKRDDIASGIYNIADDTALSTNQVIRIMANALPVSARFWSINKNLIKQIAKIGDHFPLLVNSKKLQKLTGNYVVSNSKLVKALGKPLPITAEAGLINTIESFV